jgi:uncharacterized membrane protein YtjA (UPF0391 family)
MLAPSLNLIDVAGIIGNPLSREKSMLLYPALFLLIAVAAAIAGFSGLAAGAAGIAKVLFILFLVLAAVALISGPKPNA